MDYASKASSIEANIEELQSVIESLNNTTMDTVWHGDVASTQLTKLDDYINLLDQEKTKIQNYAQTLYKLQEYKDNKNRIDNIRNQINSLPNDESYNSTRNSLYSDMSSLESNNSTLKSEILNSFNNVTSVSSTNNEISYTPSSTNLPLETAK